MVPEIIEINDNKWKRHKGDEEQDVYLAMQMHNENKILGKYADKDSYDILIDSDADLHNTQTDLLREQFDFNDENKIAFKFRKNVFTKQEQIGAYEGLFDAAAESHNRGLAAGPKTEKLSGRDWSTNYQHDVLDFFIKRQPKNVDGSDPLELIKESYIGKETKNTRGFCWLRDKVEETFPEYSNFFPKLINNLRNMSIDDASSYANNVKEKWISKTTYAAGLWSGIAGFYGRYPRIPYGRATSYTENNLDQFSNCFPFARKLEKEFARLMPNRHAAQKKYTDKIDNKFLIGEDTTFTTITVNTTTHDRNARMACHRDAGSLNVGFSNLTVISKDGKDWDGGYLVVPEVRMAINVRPGDLLLIDNMRVIHGNSPISAPKSGEENLLRMSLVFYLREDMEKLGSWDYELCRRNYVDSRRLNKEHKLWKPLWNGVSSKMWEDNEWYNYLEQKGGVNMVNQYHPEAFKPKTSLEGFFQ